MPIIVREDTDNLNAVLTITVEKNNVESKYDQELKKLKSQASIKGFRKGKTPLGFLKKMYGKKLLADLVTDLLQEELFNEVNQEDSPYIGRPIPPEGRHPVDFDPLNIEDYEFKFEIGISPKFEVKGIDEGVSLDMYKVEIPEEKVDEQIGLLKRQKGEQVSVEDNIQSEDIVTFKAKELEDGKIKENGWETTFNVIVTRLVDELQEELKSKKKGDTVRFNIYNVEKDSDREYVKKYLLNFEKADLDEGTETNEEYEAQIEDVKRLVPAELTQELLEEVMGLEGEEATEKELRNRIRTNLGRSDESYANTLLFNGIKDKLVELNKPDMPLPEEYLKRWVNTSFENESKKIMSNFEDFADDMRWTLIKNKLFKKYELNIEEEEIRQAAEARIMGYFGGQYYPGMESMIKNLVDKTMENRDEVERLASDVLSNKLFLKLKDSFKLNEVVITAEEMDSKIQAFENQNKTKWASAATEEEE